MTFKNNFWPTKRQTGLVRLAQQYQLYVLPEVRGGKLTLIIRHKADVIVETEGITDKNSSHAIHYMYEKYYRRLYATGSIFEPEKVVVEKIVEKPKPKNPLSGFQNKIF